MGGTKVDFKDKMAFPERLLSYLIKDCLEVPAHTEEGDDLSAEGPVRTESAFVFDKVMADP